MQRANQHEKLIELKRLNRNNSSARNLDLGTVSPIRGGENPKRGAVSVRRNTVNYKTQASPTNKSSYYDDETYLRRLRQKNYGKWYVKPEDYSRKIDLLNSELARIQEMKN